MHRDIYIFKKLDWGLGENSLNYSYYEIHILFFKNGMWPKTIYAFINLTSAFTLTIIYILL